MNYKLKEIVIIFVALISVSFLAFADETTNSNITNNTTQNITSSSSNTSVINQTNTNNNTSNITQNSTTSSTVNQTNNSTISQTQDITSNINQTQTVNNTSLITNNSTSENTNLNTSNVTSVTTNNNNSVSSSNIVSDNKNVNSNTNINQSVSSSTQRATQRIKSPPASAIAPNAAMSSYSQDLCTTGASAAVQTQIFGISAGKTIVDKNCIMLKNAKALFDMGMKVAAVSLMCKGNKDVFSSMMNAGTPCPVMVNGKSLIGVDAINYYENNPEERPDYEDIKHRYETKGYEIKAYKKKDFCKKYKKHKLCIK